MTSTQGWIKREEGQDITWPAFLAAADTGQVHCFRSAHEMKQVEPLHRLYTHWQPATLPEPPKEKAQWMQDLEARDEAWTTAEKVCRSNGGGWFSEGWNMALAYRDKQNAEDLEALGLPLMHTDKHPVLASLRRRCGLDKEGV